MLCEHCGAENRDSAGFCNLCLAPLEHAAPRRVMRLATATGPDWARENASEHEWYVKRHAATAEAVGRGLPTEGSTYALAARDGQARYSLAIWWSASVFTLFAWIAALRVALHDWGAAGLASQATGSSVILQSVLIVVVGIAAACALSAFVSGPDAWRTTLVNAVFWALLAALLSALAALGGPNGLPAVSVLALGTVLITAITPVARGNLGRHVPKA